MSDLLPDAIYRGAVVRTMDAASTVAEAFAVKGGTIVAVGSDAEIMALATAASAVVDLDGATVVPGLVDNHTHQLLAGLDRPGIGGKVNIAQARSIAEIKALIAAEVERVGPGQWIGTSCMFRGALEDNRFPTRGDLDAVAPDNPVYIFQSGKNVIANSMALRLAGIGPDAVDPADPEYSHGHIVKDADGAPTGHLIAGAGDLARRRWWEAAGEPMKKWDFLHFDEDVRRRALVAQMQVFNSAGITATREMGASEPEIATYRQVAEAGLATVRTDLIVGLPMRYVDTAAAEALIATYAGPRQGTETDFWRIGGFKFVLQNDGFWSHPPEKARRLILAANRLGWTLAIHGPAMTDEAAWDRLMEVLEEADAERPLAGRRFSFEHWIGTRRPAHLARLRQWGFTVAPNPPLTYFGAGRSKKMHEALQAVRIAKPSSRSPMEHARAEWGLHIRDWIDAGLRVTGGTDCPATSYDPEHPLLGMYCARTQASLAGTLLPDQVVTPEEALRMWTIDGARAMGLDRRIGSIEPGKLADFVVLTGDPVAADDEALLDIKVLRTVVSGKTVYARAERRAQLETDT
jgi:predicted amidohydrolase YtcJ